MRVSVCVGDYATTPYCVPGLEICVYSVEELCFVLRENAYLLDTSLMSDDVLEWLDEECGLKDLAHELYGFVHRKGSLSALVTTILTYVGLYTGEEIAEVEKTLKSGADLPPLLRRKNQIDYLVQKGKYKDAVRAYTALLDENEGEGEYMGSGLAIQRAAIYHNRGVAHANLMQYGQAAADFYESYRLSGDENERVAQLAAKRLELTEGEYVALISSMPQASVQSLMLEEKFGHSERAWEQHPKHFKLERHKELRIGDKQRYFEENEKLIQTLKDTYRGETTLRG